MDKTSGTRLYKDVFHTIRTIINQFDPMGFTPGRPAGAPIDEYELEVAPIAAFVINNLENLSKDAQPLVKEINRVFEDYFEVGPHPIAREIADEIIDKIVKTSSAK